MLRWQLFVLCACTAALCSALAGGPGEAEAGEVLGNEGARRGPWGRALLQHEVPAGAHVDLPEEGGAKSMWAPVGVVSICAFAMACGVGAMLIVQIPPKVEAATQNFSAGILVAAIAGELFPLLHGSHRRAEEATSHSSTSYKTFGMVVGFGLGVALMFGQKALLEHEPHEGPVPTKTGLADIDAIIKRLPKGGEEAAEGVNSVTPAAEGGDIPMLEKVRALERANSKRQLQKEVFERMVTEQSVVSGAIRDVNDMQELSRKVTSILTSKWNTNTARDDLDDELSEMHMLAGVLRRSIRGAEPMTQKQVKEVTVRMKRVDDALQRLQQHLGLSDVPVNMIDNALAAIEEEIHFIIAANIDTVEKFRRWQASTPREGPKSEVIPWSLVIGVSIDCLVDGLLVGLTYMASIRAGYIMALATSIESCFLGLSLSSSIFNATADRFRHLSISSAPVFALLIGGLGAGLLGDALEQNEALFAGFIMFSIVSLLFLVTQELLLTAHAITDEKQIWYININLFLGAGMVILIEQLLG